MENKELSLLLSANRLNFHWNETSSAWMLTDQGEEGETFTRSERQHADNLGAAQEAAILFIHNFHKSNHPYPTESAELEALLRKHRLTFNWGNPGLRWWLVGQKKGTNTLIRSVPQPAKDIDSAKAAAIRYIQERFENPLTPKSRSLDSDTAIAEIDLSETILKN